VSRRVSVAPIARLEHGRARTDQDLVAVEAPLTLILLPPQGQPVPLGVVMRTPGDDEDLAHGLLYAEGVIEHASDILSMSRVTSQAADEAEPGEALEISVAPHVNVAVTGRALTSTSACGLCGRLRMLTLDRRRPPPAAVVFAAATIAALPAHLRAQQTAFAETGGLHAAALFDQHGAAWLVREDVGRHNAVDKVVGAALTAGRLPAGDAILAVSGRVAFEIVHKAAIAGVAAVVAVGAPSSLAVDAARAAGLTLVGFARDGRFNVYTGHERIAAANSG
jgi:FdhD protein